MVNPNGQVRIPQQNNVVLCFTHHICYVFCHACLESQTRQHMTPGQVHFLTLKTTLFPSLIFSKLNISTNFRANFPPPY